MTFKYTQRLIFLELKPPTDAELKPEVTTQLFSIIHSIGSYKSLINKIFNISNIFSFELVSTKEGGIRYLIGVNKNHQSVVEKNLLSFLPGIEIKKTDKYLLSNANFTFFSLSNNFIFPLKAHDKLDQVDPIAYLTGSMTKLKNEEFMAMQLLISPVKKSSLKQIKTVSKLIYANKDLLTNLSNRPNLLKSLLLKTIQILFLPIGMMIFVLTGGKEGPWLEINNNQKDKTTNPYQKELETSIKQKIDQELFSCSIRLAVKANETLEAKKRSFGFSSALFSITNTNYQSLKLVLKSNIFLKLKQWLFNNRFQVDSENILCSSEIGDLYHFPFFKATKTEDILKVHSKQLPAPVSLKKANNLDVIFAQNHYGGVVTDIGLTMEERRRHMYVLGATGTGKSTMLLSMIKQDLENNKGLCVIDPHGELVDDILSLVPEDRVSDVIYFNPDDISFPVGLNLLELPTDLEGDLLLREKEIITESIISLFHKVYDEKYSGPRMEYILRNTIHTAFTVKNPTLFTVYKLLINDKYQRQVTKNLEDENLIDFWKYEFNKAGDYQKVKMISPITNKIGRFLFSPIAKRILEQEKSTIDFDQIVDQGKILLCNVSKGKIGEDNSQVFGALIMTKIQLAALKRAKQISKDRTDFFLYVDEFQNFATPSFAQILSEARKYKLNAILAHQTTSQLQDKSLVNVTLANTGTVICFRTANPEDEKLILPQFMPYVKQGEIDNLPSFNFYIKIAAISPEEPFSGRTIYVDTQHDQEKLKKIIEASRDTFAKEFIKTKSAKKQKKSKPKGKVVRAP